MEHSPDIYNKDCQIYREGMKMEELIGEWIEKHPKDIEWFGGVKSITPHITKEAQKSGDYTLTNVDGSFTIDVKQDVHLGKGNLLAEYYCYYSSGYKGKGWMLYGKYDYIVFVAPASEIFYVVDFPKYKQAVLDYVVKNGFDVKTTLIQRVKGKKMWSVLIPEEECLDCWMKYYF